MSMIDGYTKKLLYKTAPGPLGEGKTLKEAAKELGIHYNTAKYKLKKFKERFPEAWKHFNYLKTVMNTHKYSLKWRRTKNQKRYIKTFTDLSLEYERPIIEILENSDRIKGFF